MLMDFINTFRLFSSNENSILGATAIRLKNNEQKKENRRKYKWNEK